MPATTWNELIERLEALWLLFELWDGLPSPPVDEVPSVALDAACDDWLTTMETLTPGTRPRREVAQWLRIRALAAWALAQTRAMAGESEPSEPLERELENYLVREWHEGGLREWRFRASLPGPE